MHYTGMAAAHFIPSPEPADSFFALGVSWVGAFATAGIALLLLALSLLGTVAERFLIEQTDKLEFTEQRYQVLFEKSLAAIELSKLDGEIIDCNPAFLDLLGFKDKSELVSRSLLEVVLTPESCEQFRLLIENGSVSARETRVRRKDDRYCG